LAVVPEALAGGVLAVFIYMVALAYFAGYRSVLEFLLCNHEGGSGLLVLDVALATNPKKSYPNTH